ncbi:hypothetical protein GHYDROH2_07810 [Geobacter hydrogenophilus]|uniref:Uncharacterized protein n=2 Tax=Geobacter hydrogenophilus TaxID=40983 RepID=A0A9W6FYA2_9BACT|nr:hypothetical protein GHYDROH2_07810 [Geobacter hydrogenophilus]
MNYHGTDYVLGHILRAARITGKDKLEVDFLAGTAEPSELLVAPVKESVEWYCKTFADFVNRSGSDIDLIVSAKMTFKYDLKITRPYPRDPKIIENPYTCDVVIIDNRQKEHAVHFESWWFPE